MSRRSARRGTRLALGAAALGLTLAPCAALGKPSATVTVADVGHRPLATADTIDPGSMTVANTSTAGEKIVSITIDLVERPREPSEPIAPAYTCDTGGIVCDGPAQLPGLAFDPNGGAGDLPGKPLTLDSSTGTTGFAAPPEYAEPVGAGFGAVTATFPVDVQPNDHPADFDDGDSAAFSFDVDPISIQGATAPAPAAAIAGSELIGASIAITFSDGSTLFNDLSLVPGSDTDARAVLALTTIEQGGVGVLRPFNGSTRIETAHPDQTVVVNGSSNVAGILMVAEGELDLTGAPGGGAAPGPLEANTLTGIREIPFTTDGKGRADVPVALAPGITVITAYPQEAPGAGPVSRPVVFRLDPSIETDPPTVVSIEPAATVSETNAQGLAKVVFSEPMDAGTVAGPPPFTFPYGLGIRVTPGSAGEWTDPDDTPIPTIPLGGEGSASFSVVYRDIMIGRPRPPMMIGPGQYTVTVRPNVFDVHGNRLVQGVSKTFVIAADPPGQPTTPESHQPPPPVPAPTARTGEPVCAPVPPREPGGEPGVVRLDASQLLISQRIAQAAVRRANAAEAWLEAGIVGGDLCGNAFGPADFAGVEWVGGAANPPVAPAPRPITVAAGGGRDGEAGDVALSAAQLLINQRISQAAVRRVDALIARIRGGLTGGDLVDGAMGPAALWTGLKARSSTPATPVARSKTVIGRREGGGGKVRVSVAQLRINQRISQAAVRRVNALVARLQRGLTGAEFKDGSLTAADLGPGARP